jgi:hypothetical protein
VTTATPRTAVATTSSCIRGSFAMDRQGHFYLSGTPAAIPGPAIVKIDKDTLQCTYVSMIATENSLNDAVTVGGGFSQVQFPFRGLEWANDKLYAISNTQLHEIDPASGDRALVTNAAPSALVRGRRPTRGCVTTTPSGTSTTACCGPWAGPGSPLSSTLRPVTGTAIPAGIQGWGPGTGLAGRPGRWCRGRWTTVGLSWTRIAGTTCTFCTT